MLASYFYKEVLQLISEKEKVGEYSRKSEYFGNLDFDINFRPLLTLSVVCRAIHSVTCWHETRLTIAFVFHKIRQHFLDALALVTVPTLNRKSRRVTDTCMERLFSLFSWTIVSVQTHEVCNSISHATTKLNNFVKLCFFCVSNIYIYTQCVLINKFLFTRQASLCSPLQPFYE